MLGTEWLVCRKLKYVYAKLLKIKTFFNDRAAERDEKEAYIHIKIVLKIRKRILIYNFCNIIFKMLIQHLQNEQINVFIYF